MSETYEQLRDSTSGELAAAWKGADRRAELLATRYHELKNDPRYTEEYKGQVAWGLYEAEAPRILAERQKARELLEKEARFHEEMSIPRPKGESLRVGSAERLLAAQNQAARVVRIVERLETRADKSPIGRPSTSAVLRDEYARGIEVGGIEGVAVCKGVLMAAEELGISREDLLNSLRPPEDFDQLTKAQRFALMAGSIGKRFPEPPFPRPGSPAAASLAGRRPTHMFVPRSRGQQVVSDPGHTAGRKTKSA